MNEQLILKGAPVAKAITEDTRRRVMALTEKGIVPMLAVIRAGEDSSDISYENGLIKRAAEAGVEIKRYILPERPDKNEMLSVITDINADSRIHGCLMFRPFKDRKLEREAALSLSAAKDMDCMTPMAQALVYTGDISSFPPCTAQAVMEVLKFYRLDTSGKRAVILGRSLVIGKPVAMLLLESNATVTICHSRTEGLREICRSADILVAAIGKAEAVDESYLREGQIIIDVGINTGHDGKLCGDVSENAKKKLAGAYTPVPGGVGSVTTAVLMKHVAKAAERTVRNGK